MKYLHITILLLISSFTLASAQRGQGGDKIKAYQIAFFTQKLDLTSAEAKVFWPVYDAYQKERRTLRKELRTMGKKANDESLTDRELEAIINKRFVIEQQKIDLEKSYYLKFKKVLPLRKVAKLPQVEKAFKENLLKEMKQKRRARN